MRVIGFTGPMGSGKTTAATTLYNSDPARYKIAPMAETLKNMIKCLGVDTSDKDAEFAPGITVRQMMQTLGTEWGRCMIHPDVWIWAWLRMHDREQRVLLIDDVRFENEAEFVRRHGVLIHITRLPWGGSHASERGVAVTPWDWAMSETHDLGMLQHIACEASKGVDELKPAGASCDCGYEPSDRCRNCRPKKTLVEMTPGVGSGVSEPRPWAKGRGEVMTNQSISPCPVCEKPYCEHLADEVNRFIGSLERPFFDATKPYLAVVHDVLLGRALRTSGIETVEQLKARLAPDPRVAVLDDVRLLTENAIRYAHLSYCRTLEREPEYLAEMKRIIAAQRGEVEG